MNGTVFIIHRWDAKPTSDWYLWLSQQLDRQGLTVLVPPMPHTEAPIIEEWVETLRAGIGNQSEPVYLIGHSIGCQTIIRTLPLLPKTVKIMKTLLVAPWIRLVNLEGPESEAIARPWTEIPIDWEAARLRCSNWVGLLSDNDPWVQVGESEVFKDKLGAHIVVEHQAGHFTRKEERSILREF